MKNLEIEYKKEIASEVPDLWARIEAGINSLPAQNMNSVEVNNINNNVVSFNTYNDINAKKNKKRRNIAVISSVLGAVACLVVAVTVVINISAVKSEKGSSDSYKAKDEAMSEMIAASEESFSSSQSDEAAYEATATEVMEEAAAEMEEDSYMYEEAAESEAATEEMAMNDIEASNTKREEVKGPAAGSQDITNGTGAVKREASIEMVAKVSDLFAEGDYRFITIETQDSHEQFIVFVSDESEWNSLQKAHNYITISLYEYSSDNEKPFDKDMWDKVKYEYMSHEN